MLADAPLASSRKVVSDDRKPFPTLRIKRPSSGANTFARSCIDMSISFQGEEMGRLMSACKHWHSSGFIEIKLDIAGNR
jgi:hypothetical protein